MVNSYSARTKTDNSALFISCSLEDYFTVRWTVPTFLSISWLLQSPGPHHTADRTSYHFYKVSYLLTRHELCRLFCSKMCIIVAMVTGPLLGLQVSGGLCPDRNGKTVMARKKFTIWYICTIKCTVGH